MRGLLLAVLAAGCARDPAGAPSPPPDPAAARIADLSHRAKERETAGDPTGAEEAWEGVLALRPGHGSALYATARLRAARGDVPGALARLGDLRASEPQASRGWLLEAEILRAAPAPDRARAEAAAREALARNPEESGPHLALGRVLLEQGRCGEAAGRLEVAARMNPRDAESRSLLGVLALRDGRRDDARRWFHGALGAGRPVGGIPGEGDTRLSLSSDRPPTRGEVRAAAGLSVLGEEVGGFRLPPEGADSLLGP